MAPKLYMQSIVAQNVIMYYKTALNFFFPERVFICLPKIKVK